MLLFSVARVCAADSTAAKAPLFQGVFVDVDVVEPLVSVLSDKHKGGNASLSVNLKNVFFPTALVGYASYDASADYASYLEQPAGYTYKVSGPYFKLGVDFNLIKSKKVFKPEGFLGVRYACSPFSFDVNNVYVHQAGWDVAHTLNISSNTFAQWGEFVGGVRVPVCKRLFLGFEGCYKWAFHPKNKSYTGSNGVSAIVNQTYAPGFGDLNGVNWGFRYMVSFFL